MKNSFSNDRQFLPPVILFSEFQRYFWLQNSHYDWYHKFLQYRPELGVIQTGLAQISCLQKSEFLVAEKES